MSADAKRIPLLVLDDLGKESELQSAKIFAEENGVKITGSSKSTTIRVGGI